MYTTKEFWHPKIGNMYEMNNVSAAVGLGQLEHINELLIKKQLIFQWYEEELSSLYPMNFCEIGNTINYWMSSIVLPSRLYRTKLRRHLRKHNIDTRPFFYPISMFGVFPKRHETKESYNIGLRGMNLPSTVRLSKEEVKYVASIIKDFATHYTEYSR
jgi:perosamine synthetase